MYSHTIGYPVSIFLHLSEDEVEKFKCSKCRLIMRDPVQCLYGHMFCNNCISGWSSVKPNTYQHCPTCLNSPQHINVNNNNNVSSRKRKNPSNSFSSAFVYRNALNVKRVICDHSCTSGDRFLIGGTHMSASGDGSGNLSVSYRCEWKGILKNLDEHKMMHSRNSIQDCKVQKIAPLNCHELMKRKIAKDGELAKMINRFNKLSDGINKLVDSVDEVKEEYGRFITDQDLLNYDKPEPAKSKRKPANLLQAIDDRNVAKLRDIRSEVNAITQTKSLGEDDRMLASEECTPFASDDTMFQHMQSLTLGEQPNGQQFRRASNMLRNQLSTPRATPIGEPGRKQRHSAMETPSSLVKKDNSRRSHCNSAQLSPLVCGYNEGTSGPCSSLSSSSTGSSSTSLRSNSSKKSLIPVVPRPVTAKFTKVTISEPKNFRKSLQARRKERLIIPSLPTDVISSPSNTTSGRSGQLENDSSCEDIRKRLFHSEQTPMDTPESQHKTPTPMVVKRPRTAKDQKKSMQRLTSGLSTISGVMRVGDYATVHHSKPHLGLLRTPRSPVWSPAWSESKMKCRPRTSTAKNHRVKPGNNKVQSPGELRNVDFVCDHVKEMDICRNI